MRGLKYFRYLFLVTLLLFGFPNRNFAQFYNGSQQNFGKNRIQREDFIWTFYAFERFDTYFYTGGREIATYVSKKANGYISELEKYFEQPLTDRLQFLVFNRISDMKQSNVGFNDDEMYNTGGLTQITGTKILIFYDGNHKHLERQIRGGIAQVMLNQFVFGDNVGSMIKNSTLISFPNWYLQGLVSYLSEEWNTGIDNVVKDGIMTGKFRKFNDMEGRQAVLAGHSIWKYIADKYGRSIIPNIIYMAKISRNIESGFLLNLGVSFKSLMKEWIGHYKGIYGIFDESAEPPMKNTDTKKISKQKVVSKPCISNDGRYIGYATNMSGRFAVCLYDTEKKKNKVLYRGGHKLDETVDYNYPLMAFHPKMNVFSYMVERKGEILLNLYDLDEKTQDKVKMLYFSQILDFEYSDDGKTMVLSGVLYGKTDIFLYDIPSRSSTPVTNDYYDDVTPVFIRNSTEIVFASNRNSDSLSSGKLNADDAQDHFDLFSYSLTSPAMELKRLTKTELADEWQPEPYNSSTFSYLSDENGVFNRYVAAIDSSISFVDTVAHYQYFVSAYPTTHYKTGILEQDFNPRAGKYIELTFSRGRYKFCTSDIVVRESLERKTLTPTYFRTISKMFAERTVKTSTQSENKKTETRIINVSVKDTPKQTDTIPLKEGKVDIYNYVFDIEKPKKKITYASNDTIVSLTEDSPPLFILPRQRNYEVEFYLNKLVTQADFNYMNEIYQPFTGSYNP
ncbi:MAG: hypothetical protein KKD31_11840, partial [Bacteroidetes bacterium]|nr:hypothetical protein [Bacteroidota bacterium]